MIEPTEESTGPTSAANSAAESPIPLKLQADEVHIWLANLNDFAPESLRPLLAEDELARAARFHFERDRSHFIVARGLLRKLLASYLETEAPEVSLDYGAMGKPSLRGVTTASLQFNLAHSNGLALYVFSRERAVGVDLEWMRDDVAEEQLAERFFSKGEVEALKSLPLESRRRAFFDCWTRKEAYIKARGEGLSMPLAEFEVSLGPEKEAALMKNFSDPDEVRRWSMKAIDVPAGYVAAVVAEGQDWRLKEHILKRTFF